MNNFVTNGKNLEDHLKKKNKKKIKFIHILGIFRRGLSDDRKGVPGQKFYESTEDIPVLIFIISHTIHRIIIAHQGMDFVLETIRHGIHVSVHIRVYRSAAAAAAAANRWMSIVLISLVIVIVLAATPYSYYSSMVTIALCTTTTTMTTRTRQ